MKKDTYENEKEALITKKMCIFERKRDTDQIPIRAFIGGARGLL